MKKLIAIVLALVATPLVLAAGFAAYLLSDSDFQAPPLACGARGEAFEVRCTTSVPYLVVNGLPYPTDFEDVAHRVQSLDGRWKLRLDPDERGEAEAWFRLEDAGPEWRDTTVPGTFNHAGGELRDYRGAAWFFLRFRPGHAADADHFVRLGFDGVLLRSRVWLNGTLLGAREGGYTPFFFDATDALAPDRDNTLVVRIDNRLTWNSLPPRLREHHRAGWAEYGGIYRSVRLEWLPRQYVFKAVARPVLEGADALLELTVATHHHGRERPYQVAVSVFGPGGERLARGRDARPHPSGEIGVHEFAFALPGARRWSPADPALHRVEIALESEGAHHRVGIRTGLREIRVQGTQLALNGEPLFLRGISKHEDDPVYGAAQPPQVVERDLALVRDLGANYIRLAHYPHAIEAMRRARDLGLLLGEEIPYYQTGTGLLAALQERASPSEWSVGRFGTRQLADPTLLRNAQQQLIEMIERDVNNPAIILWGVANESFTWSEQAGAIHGWLADVVRAFDATRPITMAEMTTGIPWLDGRRAATRHMDVASVNMYYGWYFGEAAGAEAGIDAFHADHPGKPVILSEFGASAAPGRRDADGVWKAERVHLDRTYSEDYQERLVRTYLAIIRRKPFVTGLSPWVFADFFCPWFPNNPIPYYNLKGILSSERRPKLAYHALAGIYQEIAR